MNLGAAVAGGLVGGTLADFATSALNTLFKGANLRSIGGLVAPCTISERHTDQLVITDHPVESGANITDHAYMQPQRVDITIAYGSGLTMSLSDYYQKFLDLQSSRATFEIVTGKRKYKDMLIEAIEVQTDARSENLLMIQLHCRQVIIVSTQILQTASTNQASAPATAIPTAQGSQQLVTPPPSWAVNVNAQAIPGVSA